MTDELRPPSLPPRARALGAAALVLVALLVPGAGVAARGGEASSEIVFVDVKAGDGVVMRIGEEVIVSDVGEFNVGKVYEALEQVHATQIDRLILTHPHDDHIKNAKKLVEDRKFPIRHVYRSANSWWEHRPTNWGVLKATPSA